MPRHRLLPAGLVVALLLPGCMWTPRQRRNVGAALLVSGAAVAVAGVAITGHYLEESRDDPSYAPDLPTLGGMAVAGSGIAGVGIGFGMFFTGWFREVRERQARGPSRADVALAEQERAERERTGRERAERDRVKHDKSACVAWQSSYEAEGDPGRRQVLIASRPGHCAPQAGRLAPPGVRP
jgi:hypothetical protein